MGIRYENIKDGDEESRLTTLVREHSESGHFIIDHGTDYVMYSDIVNALNISIFEDYCKMFNKLCRPFKEVFVGSTEEFIDRYSSFVLDYIINHKTEDSVLEDVVEHDESCVMHSDIVNALDIAIFEDNCKMANKLGVLFKKRFTGSTDEFEDKYGSDMLKYVINHNDFDAFLKQIGKEPIAFPDSAQTSSAYPKVYQCRKK